MKTTVGEKKKESVELKIVVDEADLAPIRRQVIEEHRGKVKADGFRPGKHRTKSSRKNWERTMFSKTFWNELSIDFMEWRQAMKSLRPLITQKSK